MKITDVILPHRFFINKSLRKAAGDLRDHIDRYQEEYKEKIKECQNEIAAEKAAMNNEYEHFRGVLIDELAVDSEFFDVLLRDVLDYAETYYQQKYLKKMLDVKRAEKGIIKGDIVFLKEQMSLIGDEIELLEARKEILSTQAQVNDVVSLISMSCPELELPSENDAQALMEYISILIQDCEPDQWHKKAALSKLKGLLSERVEFQAEIKYINWVMRQKKTICSQLRAERNRAKELDNKCYSEIRNLRSEAAGIERTAWIKAKKVCDIWEVPIAEITQRITKLETPDLKEYRAIRKRLRELYRNKEYREKLQEYELVNRRVDAERARKEAEYAGRFSEANTRVTQSQLQVTKAAAAVERSKKADNRFLIAKLFSEPPEVKSARATWEKSKRNLYDSQQVLLDLEECRKSDIRDIERQRGYRPSEYHPSDEEYEEIKPLMARKKELAAFCDYDAIERELNSLYQERNRWYERRNMVFQLCKKNHVFVLSERNRGGQGEH